MAHTRRPARTARSKSATDSFLLKIGSKALLGLVIVVTFLTVTQCTVKKPEAPSWDTQLTVPLISRTYDMAELVDRIDQEGIEMDEQGVVYFTYSQELDPVGLDSDELSTDDLSYSVSEQLGPISIDAPQVDPVNIFLSDLTGLTVELPGDSGIVPDTTFTVTSELAPISSFSSATFSQSTLTIEIENGLGFSLDNVSVDLRDAGTDALVASGTATVDTIHSGETGSVPINLTGRTVPASLKVVTSYHTTLTVVTNFSTRYVSTDVVFSPTLEVSAAVAVIPAIDTIDFAQAVNLSMGDGEQLDTASLAGGSLEIAVTNNTALPSSVTIRINELELSGQPFEIEISVAASATVTVTRNLLNYNLIPVNNGLSLDVSVSSPGSGDQLVTINQTDDFAVEASLANLAFSSVTGIFAATEASFDNLQEQIEVPEGFDAIELTTAIITLEVDNGVDLPGTLDLQIAGDNGKSLTIQGDIARRGTALSTSTSSIVNDEVADFFSPIPGELTITGSVTFGDGSQGTIRSADSVFSRITVYAPLEVIINETLIETDIEEEEIDQADISAITDHVTQAELIYSIVNDLPVGASVLIHLDGDSTKLSSDSAQLTIGEILIGADTASTGIISLDNEDIRVLENELLYIGTEITLLGSNGEAVTLSDSNSFAITARIEIQYRFDGEF